MLLEDDGKNAPVLYQSANMNGRDDCLDFPKDLCNPPLIATKGVNAANGPDLE